MEVREQRASLSPKLGYVGTDLGVLPADWKVVSIADAGEVVGGRQRSPHAQGTPTKYLRVANVFDGHIDTSDVLEMPFTSAEKARFRLRVGDILLNEGQSLELVGRSAMFRGSPEDCCFQNTLVRFRVGGQNVPQYLQSVFQRYLHTGVFSTIALQTTSIAHLGTTRFAALLVPLPPTEEQKAIAGALGDIDALIESLEQLLVKKRQIKQGAMQELLTGQRRLPGFAEQWRTARLRDISRMKSGDGITSEDIDDHSPYACYGGNGLRGFCDRYTHDGTFVLIGRQGALCGNVGFVEGQFFASEHAIVVTVSNYIDARWLAFVLVQMNLNQYSESSAQPGLSAVKLLQLQVRVPILSEQTAIATTLSDVDAEITALEARVAKTRLLKQGMAQALLTGRIRLV